MSEELFTGEGSTVCLKRNPELTEIPGVKSELLSRLEAGGKAATLDVTALENLSSTTLGMTVAVHLRAVEAGRGLKVRIRRSHMRLFELTMLTGTLDLEIVDGADAQSAPGEQGQ